MVGAVLPSAAPGGKLFSGPDFHPLWEEAQRLDVPVSPHGGMSFPDLGIDDTRLHGGPHPGASVRAVPANRGDDLRRRVRDVPQAALRRAGVRRGLGPYLMDRLDEEYERKGHYSPNCKRKPSEYFREGNIYFAAEVEETLLPETARLVPEHTLLWASDYPTNGTSGTSARTSRTSWGAKTSATS